jgi:hypothetical protein
MAEKRKIHRVVDAQGTLVQVLPETSAEQVTVADAAGKLTSTNVEDALQELATNISNAGKVDDVKDANGNSIVTNKVANLSKEAVGLGNVTNDAQVKRSEMGAASGVATLDTAGKVPSSQLPSYVDDVLEYANKASFPTTGESGKIYVAQDTNLTYRWSGTAYVEISPSLALGETSSTAYAGDKGKANADNIANIISGTTKVGAASKADSATNANNATNATNAQTAEKVKNYLTFMYYTSPGSSKQFQDYNGEKHSTVEFGYDFDAIEDRVYPSVHLRNTGVTAGSYSAVTVDKKGRVTAGGKSVEWGTSGQTAPSDGLMVGGLFFELQ